LFLESRLQLKLRDQLLLKEPLAKALLGRSGKGNLPADHFLRRRARLHEHLAEKGHGLREHHTGGDPFDEGGVTQSFGPKMKLHASSQLPPHDVEQKVQEGRFG
jgi:hypothetical protein